MDNPNLQSIKDILANNEKIAIAVGKNPNIDEMAAALSLYLSLGEIGKSVVIACPTDPIVEISSLVGIDKVSKNIEGAGPDLIVSFPYREGEIDKVSYTLEDGYLNIVVKGGEKGMNFNDQDVRFRRGGSLPKTLFIIGTPNLSDLGNIFNPESLKDTKIVNIDNKEENQGFGDYVFVSPRFSSVSEEIGYILKNLGLTINIDIAQNILSGITFATDNFQNPKTSAVALEIAALAIKEGAIRHRIPSTNRISDEGSFTEPVSTQANYQNQKTQSSQSMSQFPQRNFGHVQQTPRQAMPFGQQPKEQPEEKPIQPQNNLKRKDKNPPSDWLTPKVYKGSTLV
ncbi:MAG: hypothetical protein M1524_01390 [Patescibacteria group bacterium]|nr:hypothetical protein [Patescibacteria group bacterium]